MSLPSMQKVNLNLGHVINFIFMTRILKRSILVRKLNREDCACRYISILYTKHPSKGLCKALKKGVCETPIESNLHKPEEWSL